MLEVGVHGAGMAGVERFVFVVFQLGLGLGHFMGNATGMREDIAFVEIEKGVELGNPIGHVHRDAAHGLALCKNEVLLNEVVQGGEFGLGEVVFGNRDIGLADQGTATSW